MQPPLPIRPSSGEWCSVSLDSIAGFGPRAADTLRVGNGVIAHMRAHVNSNARRTCELSGEFNHIMLHRATLRDRAP
jgi:hypothetical protein